MAPLIRASLERGDPPFVATAGANVDALREELGADAAAVTLRDTLEWAPRPAERLSEVRDLIAALPSGARLCAFGEPIWTGSAAIRREWARYESIVNTALAGAPLTCLCLYDGAGLPDEVLAHAACTHGQLLAVGSQCESAALAAPAEYVAALAADARPAKGEAVEEIPFDGDPHAFRSALAAIARERGLDAGRIGDLVIAANEVAANGVIHGRPPVRIRIWTTASELVCEVADAGAGIHDPLVGWTIPDRADPGGWGLALARRLCDALEVVPAPGDSRVYLHLALAG